MLEVIWANLPGSWNNLICIVFWVKRKLHTLSIKVICTTMDEATNPIPRLYAYSIEYAFPYKRGKSFSIRDYILGYIHQRQQQRKLRTERSLAGTLWLVGVSSPGFDFWNRPRGLTSGVYFPSSSAAFLTWSHKGIVTPPSPTEPW